MRFACLSVVLLLSCATVKNRVTVVPAATVAPRVAVDTHIHLNMDEAAKPIFIGNPGSGTLVDNSNARLVNQIDAEQMRAAGLKLVLSSVWPPYELRPGRTSIQEALHQLDLLHVFALRHSEFSIVSDTDSIQPLLDHGRIVLVPQVEGGEGILSVDDVDRLYAAGARCIVMMHFADSSLGGSAAGQVASVLGIKPSTYNPQGLTELGKKVIARMADLGMIIDVAHASDQFIKDTLEITEPRGVPIIVSHTAARTLYSMERNVSDELAKRVVAGGGLIGVTLYRGPLKTDEAHLLTDHIAGTCDDFVAHWKYLASVVGAENLVLGSDFNGFIARPVPGGQCPNGVRNTGDLNDAWAALVANGIPHEALDGMGDHMIRLMKTLDAKASPQARAQAMRFRNEARAGFFEAK